MLAALKAAWAEACDERPEAHVGLAGAQTVWHDVDDDSLDRHVAGFGNHRRVHCRRNPDGYARDIDDEQAARLACTGCPIVLACREQALRQEQGAGESHGIRGGLTARARQLLIATRTPESARTILPATVTTNEALALLAARGYVIKRNTLQQKAAQGNAPKPLKKIGNNLHWDAQALMQWDFTVNLEYDCIDRTPADAKLAEAEPEMVAA